MENNNNASDEIKLKDLVLMLQEYFFEVLKNWYWIILCTIPFILLYVYKTHKAPITFPATLTFMVNEDDGGGLGALGGLAASFGLGGAGSEHNLDKMHTLLKSRNIIQQALFKKETLNGKEDFFANHFLTVYQYYKDLEEDPSDLKNFKFTNDNFDEFSRIENVVLKKIYGRIIGNSKAGIKGLMSSSINEETGIMNIKFSGATEELSIKFVKCLFDKLGQFYIDKTIEKQKQTYEITKTKVDSLRDAMNSAQYRLLKMKDTRRNLTLRQYEAEEIKLQRQVQIMTLVYGEALKNQEIADFSLKSRTPFIQTIDTPIPPLGPSKGFINYIISAIIGGILGGFIAVTFFIGRKIVRDAMQEE
ncbi:MAG: hypothetical protein AB8H03_24105 [Saprospiraceae bacterium]